MKYRNYFLNTIEKVTLMTATISFVICIYYAAIYTINYLSIKDYNPDRIFVSYEMYQDHLGEFSNNLDSYIRDELSTNKRFDSEQEKLDYISELDAILKEIIKISSLTDKIIPNSSVVDRIYNKCVRLKKYIPIKENLKILQAEMINFTQNLEKTVKLDPLDIKYHTWTDFIEYYFDNLQEQIDKQRKYESNQLEQNINHRNEMRRLIDDGKIYIYIIISSIVIFMILCIVKNTNAIIELKNTINNNNK